MILLASKSPRRQELLKMLDVDFKIVDGRDVDEVYPSDLSKAKVPEFLSQLKASAYKDMLEERDILLTADTIVLLHDEIIGKPKSLEDAKSMLSKLSGNIHKVITGVTLTSITESKSFSVVTDVKFAPLTSEAIDYYVETYRPLDKAGAYGIQEWIGAVGVEGIEGSFYNVMGLPVHQLYRHLLHFSK